MENKNKFGIGLFTFSRILVGGLFIVSGLIKANDPLGFSYKLEEYFSEGALNMPYLIEDTLLVVISSLICIAEIVLGIMLLMGAAMRFTVYSILLMILFFTGLTYYTATCEPQSTYTIIVEGESVERQVECVLDCGCFGDALKGSVGRSLTPWESFSKDAILLFFCLILFIGRNWRSFNKKEENKILIPGALLTITFFCWVFGWYFPLLFGAIALFFSIYISSKLSNDRSKQFGTILIGTIVSIAFPLYVVMYLPVKDYRPYAVGKNIHEQMIMPDSLQPPVFATIYTLIHLNTKETIVVNSIDYLGKGIWGMKKWEGIQKVLPLEIGSEELKNAIGKWKTKEGEKEWGMLYDFKNTKGKSVKGLIDSQDKEEIEKLKDNGYSVSNAPSVKIKDGYIPSIQDFKVLGFYSQLSDDMKSHPLIDSTIQMEYNPPYVSKYYTVESTNGEKRTISAYGFKKMLAIDSSWSVLAEKDSVVDPGNDPLINITDYVLEEEDLLIIVARDVEKGNRASFEKVKSLVDEAKAANRKIIGLSTSSDKELDKVREEFDFELEFYQLDDIELKIIIRSNPGLIWLNKGTVLGKWPYRKIPRLEEIK